jgi:predicted RND superfamily exporter protein
MTNFFEKRDRWGNGFSLWILLGCLFLAPLCAWSLSQTRIENDLEHWLPEDDPNAVTLKWSMQQFDLDDHDGILVSWNHSSLLDPRVEKLAQRLEGIPDEQGIHRGGLKQISHVTTPREIIARMMENGVDRDEAIRRLRGMLIGAGPFKVRLTESGRQRQKELQRELIAKARTELGMDILILPADTDYEPLGDELEVAAAGLTIRPTRESEAGSTVPEPSKVTTVEFDPIPEHDFQVQWNGMLDKDKGEKIQALALSLKGPATPSDPDGVPLVDECFQWIGSPVAMSVVMSEAGEADKAGTLELIRQAAVAVGVPAKDLHLGGRPVANTELNRSVKAAAWNRDVPLTKFYQRSLLLMSGLVGVLMTLLMFRSVRLSAMVLFVAYFTVFVTMSLVPVTGGSMNMVLVLMPTFLLVITLSGAIHICHYWRHAAVQDQATAVGRAAQVATKPCLLATVTTAIGLLSLLTSDLKPVRDFGVYSAVGAFIGLGAILFLLPSLLQLFPLKQPQAVATEDSRWETYGRWCARHRMPIVAAYSAITLATAGGLIWFRTETKVIRYFPPESQIVQDYWFLEENLAGIVPVDVIVRFDRDSQLKLDFLERMEIVRNIENKMRAHPEITGAIALPDFRLPTPKPQPDAGKLAIMGYNRRAHETERRIKAGEVSGTRSLFTVSNQGHDLREPGDAVLSQTGDELWRITAQTLLMSDTKPDKLIRDIHQIAQSVLRFHAGTHHVVTGMVPVFLQTQDVLLRSLIQSFAVAYVVIMLVMMLTTRHFGAGFLLMLPNVAPIVNVFGLISYLGIPVDIGTMMTTSIALGIAVDGTLHKLTWFRKGIAQGKSRDDAVALAMKHGGPAIWQTTVVLSIGMLVLLPADLLLISRFGWLMAAIVFAAMWGDILYLPALLAGPLGTLVLKGSEPRPQPGVGIVASSATANVPPPHLRTSNLAPEQSRH